MDEEPYNLSTFQAALQARRARARMLFFTWQNLKRSYPLPFSWMERYVLRQAAFGLAGNQEALQVYRAKGYSGPMKVIPQFGVDPDIFRPGPGTRDVGRGVSIGYVGARLVEEKGVDVLLRAAAGLPGLWRLYILGNGPERGPLERLAQDLGIAGQVVFDEMIPSTQMPAYYSGLDVLVLPSRTRENWKEQFGRVLIEAMACGVPVVGSTSGEIPHVIGDAGLLFPENDAVALRECLTRLQRDEALWAELSRRGRQRVLEHYTQAQVAAQTVQVYQEMMAENGLDQSKRS